MSDPTKRGKKPKAVCPKCRSTKWKKSSLGFYICEFGHQLEGYQEEEGEFQEGAAGYERKIKGPKKVKKVNKVQVYQGHDASTLLLRCVQYILQLQTQALVRDLGFPKEFPDVVREYWSVYVSNLVEYHDNGMIAVVNEDTTADQGDEDQESIKNDSTEARNEEGLSAADFKDKTATESPVQDILDKQQEYQQSESESSSSEAEDDNENNDSDNQDNLSEIDNSHSGDDGVEFDDDETTSTKRVRLEAEQSTTGKTELDRFNQIKRRKFIDPLEKRKRDGDGKETNTKRHRWGVLTVRDGADYRYLSMRATIAILYIASQHLKLPVVLGDFQKWIMRHSIPFYNVLTLLPAHLTQRLPPSYKGFLRPFARNPQMLRRYVTILLRYFERLYSIGSVMPNIPRLIARFLHELMLPVECFSCALRFYHIVYDNISNKNILRRLVHMVSLRGPDTAMAIVIVVAKLIYGLYGNQRNVGNWEYWINGLPTEKEWLSSLDSFDALRIQSEIPHMQGEFEELIDVNPKLYSEHYKKELKLEQTEEQMQLLRIFESSLTRETESGDNDHTQNNELLENQQTQKSQIPSKQPPLIVPFIRKLNSDVQPVDNLSDKQKVNPRHSLVHYLNDPKGQFMGNYERLLGYASNILCILPEDLEKEVEYIESHIIVGRA
ncbi:Pol I core factor CF [Linnemannia zychae]|nr:Pol I core factor CF [Linnemannia zychae]